VQTNARFFRTVWPKVSWASTRGFTGTEREARQLARLLRLGRGARILDVPCGYGRYAVPLAQRGFRVTAIELNPALLEMARQAAASRGVAVNFRCEDMRGLAKRARFDAVLNLFGFGYFGDEEDLRMLVRFRQALRPGGKLLFGFYNRDWFPRNFRPRGRWPAGEYMVTERRRLDLREGALLTEWLARHGREVLRGSSRLRLYTCAEMLRMLREAGFSAPRVCGGFSGRPLTLGTWRLVIVASR
jgi:SAM-dependent methyltransferase